MSVRDELIRERHAKVEMVIQRDDARRELEALRAQVATLTAERDEARNLLKEAGRANETRRLETRGALELMEDARRERDAAQAACVAMREAAESLLSAASNELLSTGEKFSHAFHDATRTMDALLATDLLTRLKARGPSRFVSVEKVREVAMKVAEAVRDSGGCVEDRSDEGLTAIVDALLA